MVALLYIEDLALCMDLQITSDSQSLSAALNACSADSSLPNRSRSAPRLFHSSTGTRFCARFKMAAARSYDFSATGRLFADSCT